MAFPAWLMNIYEEHLLRAALALSVVIFALLFRKLLTRGITAILRRLTGAKKEGLVFVVLRALEKPLEAFLLVFALYFGLHFLPLPKAFMEKTVALWRMVVIVFCAWGLYEFTGHYAAHFSEAKNKIADSIDSILVTFLAKLARGIIVLLAFVIIVSELGYDINGFIAGLGLGGLTLALAAQNTAANIFGGIVLVTDKPFSIGDWIQTPSVEGVVEDIGFRSTRIRTHADALVTVPNATLSGEAVTNWTLMGRRRVSFSLKLAYSAPQAKLKEGAAQIRKMLQEHPAVHGDTIFVGFDSFGDNSLDFLVYYFTKTTSWADYLKAKEDVNYKIMGVLEKEKIAMALPGKKMFMEDSAKPKS